MTLTLALAGPPTGQGSMAPNLVSDGTGAWLTWIEPTDPSHDVAELRLAWFEDGQWGGAKTIVRRNDFFANWADIPELAVAANGDLYATWPQKSGPGTYAYDIAIARSNDRGDSWTMMGTLNDDRVLGEHGFVSLIPDGEGVRAYWLDGRAMTGDGHSGGGGDMMLRTALVDSVVHKSEPVDERACECCGTDAAIVNGNPVVVYRDRSDGEVRDISVAGTLPMEIPPDNWRIEGCPVNGPSLDARNGTAAVAWFTDAPGRTGVWLAVEGSPPVHLSSTPIGRADVAILDNGDIAACWIEPHGEEAAVMLSVDAKKEPRNIASVEASRRAGFPRLAAIPGGVLIAWTTPNGVDAAQVTSPRVLSIQPAHGSDFVSPDLTEIRVTFDQPMQDGYSFMGGGESFPKVTGPVRWIDKKTCVLPVALQPTQLYRMRVNDFAGRGSFQSEDGDIANMSWLFFQTGDGTPPPLPDVDANRFAITVLQAAMATGYSYLDRLGIDWYSRFAAYEDALTSARSPFEFAIIAGQLLAAAGDPHIRVLAADTSVPCHVSMHDQNYDLSVVSEKLSELQQRSDDCLTGRIGDIGYICIASWRNSHAEGIEPAFDALQEFSHLPMLIIDVRPNGGGAELIARRFAGQFIDKPTAYAKHWKAGTVHARTMQPSGDEPYDGHVVLLQGGKCMSSNEAFVLMMRAAGATTIGEVTAGSSGNPKPYPLGNDVTVFLPSWRAMTLDETVIEGVGIAPDIEVPFKAGNDAPFDRAVQFLREEGG
ncbi:MAG: S41 family peptidase [Phycisphaerales bacterium]|nr:S41 family peptidase [Phycisphaerales bacterium]